MVVAAVAISVTVLVLQEDGFVCEVASKSDGCDAESRETTLEPLEAGERTSVPPGLSASSQSRSLLVRLEAERTPSSTDHVRAVLMQRQACGH